jgi:hypothetical protein
VRQREEVQEVLPAQVKFVIAAEPGTEETRRREFSRRKKVAIDDQDLYLVSPEDLILSKLDWAKDSRSQVQLADVRNLLKDVKGLNRRYLTRCRRTTVPRDESVKDTSPAIEQKFRQMLLQRSGEERLKMGCSMHATAQALVKASISENNPTTVKRELFLRFYGDEFRSEERKKILMALRKAAEGNWKRDNSESDAVREDKETYPKKKRNRAKRSRR